MEDMPENIRGKIIEETTLRHWQRRRRSKLRVSVGLVDQIVTKALTRIWITREQTAIIHLMVDSALAEITIDLHDDSTITE